MNRPIHVLIVDDARDNREVYRDYLHYRGFRVTEAATGAEGMAQVIRYDPDVVLLDLRLPDINGVDVCCRLRQRHPSRPAIIALSAGVADGDVKSALECGCDTFVAKPCLPDRLEQEIERLLRPPAVA